MTLDTNVPFLTPSQTPPSPNFPNTGFQSLEHPVQVVWVTLGNTAPRSRPENVCWAWRWAEGPLQGGGPPWHLLRAPILLGFQSPVEAPTPT